MLKSWKSTLQSMATRAREDRRRRTALTAGQVIAGVVEQLEPRELLSATTETVGLASYLAGGSADTPNYPNAPVTGMDESQFLPPQSIAARGTSTGGGANTLSDSNQSWAVNSLAGFQVQVVVGTTLETATIQSNTATELTLTGNWSQAPGAGVGYMIYKLADPAAHVSAAFDQIPQTNDWWSNLLWRFQGDDASIPIYPHPFVAQFNTSGTTQGLAVAYPSKLTVTWQESAGGYNIRETDYDFFMADAGWNLTNFGLQIQGVPLTDLDQVLVESYSDWGVTVSFGNSTDRLHATMLQGSPYMYFTPDTSNEVVFSINSQLYGTVTEVDFVDHGDGTAYFGVPTLDHMVYYGLFGMPGTTWSIGDAGGSNPQLTSSGLGGEYFAMALLPPGFDPAGDAPAADAMFDTFKAHAYAEISTAGSQLGSYVHYTYSPTTNVVTTLYGADVTVHTRTFSDGTQLVNTPLMALYPHQWKASPDGTPLGDDYNYGAANNFAKGLMKLYALNAGVTNPWTGNGASTGFQTTLTHQGGLLPFLPPVTGGPVDSNPIPGIVPDFATTAPDANSLVQLIEYTAFVSPPTLDPQLDGYGTGKVLLKYANLVAIADQLSTSPNVHALDRPLMALARDKLLNTIKLELARYMGASQFEGYTQLFQFLFYNQNQSGSDFGWSSLIPYNAGYGAGQQLNDHHFHYGYFLHAAAILALYDPEFLQSAAGEDNFAGMLRLIAQDVANWQRQEPSTTEVVFPFLRNFAPYAGHSYASGHGAFASGNNQESSSEAMNFWIGLALLGEAFLAAGLEDGQTMRDLGVALYETEASNIAQYTFDVDGDIFPATFTNPDVTGPTGTALTMSAQNWDSGSHNGLFFATNYAEAPFSINWLPASGGSLYLGRHAGEKGTDSYVERNWEFYEANVQQFGLTDPTYSSQFPYPVYPGTDWAYQALYDPAGALTNYQTYFNAANIQARGNLGFDPGESAAMTLHWIKALTQYGYLDTSVTATGVSTYAAFRQTAGGDATYVAYNPKAQSIDVTFTDGGNTVVLTVAARSMAYQTGVSGAPALQPVGAVAFGTSSGSNSATTLADTTQSWFAGQFDGLQVTITGGTGAGQTRVIGSTSATVLGITQAWTTTPDATSNYSVTKAGTSVLQQPPQVVAAGVATSGGGSTLTDSTASWTTNQFAGMTVTLTFGSPGIVGQVGLIASNTATTLTLSTPWGSAPTNGTLYQITQPAPLGPQLFLTTSGDLTGTAPDDRTTTVTSVTIPDVSAGGFGIVPASSDPNTAHFEVQGVNMPLVDAAAAAQAATSQFAIWLKDHDYAAAGANQIIAVAIRYKWSGAPSGDGDWDRVEMFQTSGSQLNVAQSNAPDTNVPATFDLWNLYDSVRDPVVHTGYIQGNNPAWQSFQNGTIQVSVWMVAGGRATDVSAGSPAALGRQSFISLPSFYGSGMSFGSAPDSYGTSLHADGPRHPALGATLGTAVVVAVDGLPGTASVVAPEQGAYPTMIVPGQSSFVLADVQFASGTAFLDAWIDFDADGAFEATERITASGGTAVSAGLNTITFAVPALAATGATYARFRVSSVGGLDPTGLAPDGDIEDLLVWIDPTQPALPKTVGIEGLYFAGDQSAQVLKGAGNQLTLVMPDGSTHAATLSNDGTGFSGSAGSGVFHATSGLLGFDDGPVWGKVRQLAGSWLLPAGSGGITQNGTDLTLTNAAGATVNAHFLNSWQITAPDWGGIVGTLSREGTRLHWANGKTWDLVTSLGTTFENAQGAPVRVEQRGHELVFINRWGGTSRGAVIGTDLVRATDWGNVTGTLAGDAIHWANGGVWSRSVLPADAPDIGGLWDVNGQNTRVLQSDDGLTFVNRFGGVSSGHFVSATEVAADDWGGARGILVADRIFWQGNGIVWTRVPDLSGARIDESGALTGVSQLERSLTFTDATGNVSHGLLVGTTGVIETDGAQRQGLLAGEALFWPSSGQVWLLLPDLRGTWSVTTAGAAPAYIEQSGLDLLFVTETGRIARGRFLSPSRARLTFEDDSSVVEAGSISAGSLVLGGASLWSNVPAGELDTVFADQSMWPFV